MSNNNTNDKVLVLRTCAADMSAHGGFIWPKTGFIEAPDWKPTDCCGNGLHGLLWGEGNAAYLSSNPDANWLVCSVEKDSIIDLGGKVKFPKAEVVFCGNRVDAIRYLLANGGAGHAVVYKNISGGDYSTLTGGDDSTLTGGYRSTLTGGTDSTLTGGDDSTFKAGVRSVFLAKSWNDGRNRYHIAYVGEDGIKPGIRYRLNEGNEFEEVTLLDGEIVF